MLPKPRPPYTSSFFIILLIFLIVVTSNVNAWSQAATIVSGKVTDHSGHGIDNVSVNVLKSDSGLLYKGLLTDSAGYFKVNLAKDRIYLLKFEKIGFTTAYSSPLAVKSDLQHLKLADIVLQISTVLLKEVTVKSSKPLIVQKLDKTVMNVEGNILSAGDNAIDVFRMGPGIVVDARDQVTLNGKNVTVLINGRPSAIGREALTNYLKSLSATKISQIELISNPTAQFDAGSGNAIINIIPKAIKENGFKGNLATGYNYSKLSAANAFSSLSYKYNKLVFDLNLGIGTDGNDETSTKDQDFADGSQLRFDAHNHKRKNILISSFGINYEFHPGTYIGGVVGLTHLRTNETAAIRTLVSNSSGDSVNVLHDRPGNKNYTYTGNVYFHSELKNHSVIEAKVDFWDDKRNQERNLRSFANDVLYDTLSNHSLDQVKNYSGRVDFSLPGRNGEMFKAGLKSTRNEIFYNIDYFSLLTHLPGFNGGDFNYNESVNAAYIDNIFPRMGTWALETGLRVENTKTRSSSSINQDPVHINYTNFFPSAIIQKTFKNKVLNSINLSYTRKVLRPRYDYLNPIPVYQTTYSYLQGNAFLKPGFADQAEASLTFLKKYGLVLNYTRNSSGISSNLLTTDQFITVTTFNNLTRSNSYALILNTPFDGKKIHLNSSVRFSYINQRTEIDSVIIPGSKFNLSLNASAAYVFPKDYVLRVNAFYISPNINGQIAYGTRKNISFSLSKSWKKKYILNLKADDPFYINKENYEIISSQQHTVYRSQWNSRVFGISFVYLFDSGKSFNNRKLDKGNGEEVGRRN